MPSITQYVRPGGVESSMLQFTGEETFVDGRSGMAVLNPNPGSYRAEVYSTAPETALEIEAFVA